MIVLEKTDAGHLLIRSDDLEALAECKDLADAFEYWTCNGWEWIRPEEIGALTSGEIITDDAQRDDHGELVAVGRVYWNENYAVTDALAELQAGRSVQWNGYAGEP